MPFVSNTSKLLLLALMLSGGSLPGVTRLAFSRPGGMMRVPMSAVSRSPFLFSAGFVSEMVSISPYNSATGVYFDAEFSRNFRLGLSSVSTADTSSNLEASLYDPPLEVGLHLQQRLWTYGNISFALGVHDIVLTRDDSKFTIKPDLISYLGVISSEQQVGNFNLNTYMGFGTGTLAGTQTSNAVANGLFPDTLGTDTTSGLALGVFAGFLLKTPVLADRGGLDIVAEFDGNGINLGVRIPITSDYRLQVGLVHVENLPDFAPQSDGMPLLPDAPSVVIGLNLNVPRLVPSPAEREIGQLGPRMGEVGEGEELLPAQLDSTLQSVDYLLASLRDSLHISRFEIDNLHAQLAMRDQRSVVIEDSMRSMQLRIEMIKSNLNFTMRHLSASLNYFYSENYRESLQEVEMAIQLNPDLAIAYARRGSIYYKLGDTQRATINWNLALKLDPEYDDVRNILRALKENRSKTISIN